MIGGESMIARDHSAPRSDFHGYPEIDHSVHGGTATGRTLRRQGEKRKREASEDD